MRIARLAAPAFGPFTDFALDLSADRADLHLIFGPNEAGKSSLLRAVGDLLYGIPGQTTDAFLHEYRTLRIAATLVGRDGRSLAVQRRKGNKNTLLDADGAPLPEDALGGLLGGVDRDLFATVFALDSDRLRAGAEALLQGKGEIGQALFSASLAGTPVHRIREALEAEAAALFDGRKSKGVSIRPLLAEYKQGLEASRDALVRPEDWEQTLSAVAAAETARERLEQTLREHNARRDWVQRCLDALPVIGALAEQERRRAELPPLPDCGAGFIDETEQAQADRNRARDGRTDLERSIARLRERVEHNRPDQRLLDQAGEIESLHAALAVQRERRNARAALAAEQARLAAELAAGRRALGVDDDPAAVESLRADAEAALSLRATATVLDGATAETRTQRRKLAEHRHALEQLQARLDAIPVADPTPLRNALARTEVAAAQAARLPELETRLAAAARDCAAKRQLLPGAPEEPAAACALPVPPMAALRQCADEDARIDADLVRASADADDAQARGRRLGDDLKRLERRGVLPTEQDLRQARAQRDHTWQRVVARWRDGPGERQPDDAALAETYPQAVHHADQIADRLRADADAVARAETLREQIQSAADDAERARKARTDAADARAHWQRRWQQAWAGCGLEPGPPAQMQEWRDHWLALREAFTLWQSAAAEQTQAGDSIDAALAVLRPLLADTPGDDLAALRAAAQQQIRAADQARGAREQLSERLREQRGDLAALEAALPALAQTEAEARSAWQQRCRALALPADADTATVLQLLEQRNALVAVYDRWRADADTLAKTQQDIAAYDAKVQALADVVDLPAGSADARAPALWQALAEARARKVRQDAARRDLDDERERLPAARAALAADERRLAAQLTRAGIAHEQDLAALLEHLKRRRAIDAEIEQRRQSLYPVARGEPLDAFIERVRGEDADGLAAERQGLDQAIAGLQRERDQALRALHEAGAEQARLERAGVDAAAHLQDAKGTAARIRRDAARYLRLQLALRLLGEVIERHRRDSQGPLLARAGVLFRRATAASFDGLGTAFAGDDTPVLVGLRGDAEVGVEGMSDGTRDQLYLALRMAAVERHLAHHEPMPMLLDDLLMTFDDRRCLAVLPMLRELALQTQVLLFTHHRHLRDLAREALGEDGFHDHDLGAAARV